jgi:hypothetical protein
MACAGKTATSFMTSCTLSGTTYVPVDATSTTPLYQTATDATSLTTALKAVTTDFCCGCTL